MPALGARRDAASRAAVNAANDRNGFESGGDQVHWPRDRQRNLPQHGIAQARRIGERIRALRIPVGEVRASPFFRCMETGRAGFRQGRRGPAADGSTPVQRPARQGGAYPPRNRPDARTGHDTVLVSLSGTMTMAGALGVEEGETVIFLLAEDGGATVARRAAVGW
jgi:hypothetical protein